MARWSMDRPTRLSIGMIMSPSTPTQPRRRDPRRTRRRARRARRARARKPHARRAALALDLSPRRRRLRRHAQHRPAAAGEARRALHARAAGDRGRAGLRRRHAQMAAAHAADRPARQGRRDRVRLYPGDRPRHALRLQPGRLHAQLHVLPYRHAGLGAQPDARPRSSARSWSRATGSAISPAASRRPTALVPSRRGRARGLQHRVHGAWASRSTISTACATPSPC